MDPVRPGALPFPFNYCSCFSPLIRAVMNLAKRFFAWLGGLGGSTPHIYVDVRRLDNSLTASDLERDKKNWKQVEAEVTLQSGVFDLTQEKTTKDFNHPSGYPPFMQIGYYHDQKYQRENTLLCVKLPRRQVIYFPKLLQRELLEVPEERMELHFVIYQKPKGQKTFNAIFHHLLFDQYPKEGQEKKIVNTWLFEADGINPAHEGGISANGWVKEEVIVHDNAYSPNNMRMEMTKKVGTFFLGAVYQNCKTQSDSLRIGVCGVVLDLDTEESPIEQQLILSKTLKEFAESSDEFIKKMFRFNENY